MANDTQTQQTPKNILGQLVSQGLSPRQDNVLKTILKFEKQQVEEALQQGIPPQNILKQTGIPSTEQEAVNQISDPNQPAQLAGDQRTQISQALAGQQPQQSQVPRAELSQATNPLSGFLNAFLSKDTRALRKEGKRLENELLRQEVEGTQPLQQKDIDETILKAQLDLAKEDEKAGRLTANNIFKSFEPVANNFQGIVDSFARVQASAEDPSPAGDLALIFNFMKILDPNSVVRESEFATAQNAASVPTKIRNMYNRMVSGELLGFPDTPRGTGQRNDFRDRAERLFNSKKRQFKRSRINFQKLARKNQIDPTNIIRDVSLVEQNQFSNMSDEELQRIAGGQ